MKATPPGNDANLRGDSDSAATPRSSASGHAGQARPLPQAATAESPVAPLVTVAGSMLMAVVLALLLVRELFGAAHDAAEHEAPVLWSAALTGAVIGLVLGVLGVAGSLAVVVFAGRSSHQSALSVAVAGSALCKFGAAGLLAVALFILPDGESLVILPAPAVMAFGAVVFFGFAAQALTVRCVLGGRA